VGDGRRHRRLLADDLWQTAPIIIAWILRSCIGLFRQRPPGCEQLKQPP